MQDDAGSVVFVPPAPTYLYGDVANMKLLSCPNCKSNHKLHPQAAWRSQRHDKDCELCKPSCNVSTIRSCITLRTLLRFEMWLQVCQRVRTNGVRRPIDRADVSERQWCLHAPCHHASPHRHFCNFVQPREANPSVLK